MSSFNDKNYYQAPYSDSQYPSYYLSRTAQAPVNKQPRLTRRRIVIGICLIWASFLVLLPTTTDKAAELYSDISNSISLPSFTQAQKHQCLDAIELQRDLLISSYKQSFYNVTHVALVDYPDHNNAGDAAILLGELLLLESLGIEIRYVCTLFNYNATELDASLADIPRENTAIALHGGGNFGNIWVDPQHFRMRLINSTLDRRIRSFPQTYEFFEPTETRPNQLLADTQAIYARYPDLELVGRDHQSFEQITDNFPDNVVKLTPDAAVMIGSLPDSAASPRQMRFSSSSPFSNNFGWPSLELNTHEPAQDVVVIARNDREGGQDHRGVNWTSSLYPFDVQMADWADHFGDITFGEKRTYSEDHSGDFLHYWVDKARFRVEQAMDLMLSAHFVVTDRLHAHVMSTLLGVGHVVIEETKLRKVGKVHDSWCSACAVPLGTLVKTREEVKERESDANSVFVTNIEDATTAAMSLLTIGWEEEDVSYARVVPQEVGEFEGIEK